MTGGGAIPRFGGNMKIRLEKPLNINGISYRYGDELQLPPEEAKALIKSGLAISVIERAVLTPRHAEIRDVD